jgi:hypothetical protein
MVHMKICELTLYFNLRNVYINICIIAMENELQIWGPIEVKSTNDLVVKS